MIDSTAVSFIQTAITMSYISLLLIASIYDFRTRTIPMWVNYNILLLGVPCLKSSAFWGMAIVPLPYLIVAVKTGHVGGGDIKYMLANGFFLGLKGGMAAGIIGLCLAVCIQGFRQNKESLQKESFPLAPYLSIGCFISYVTMII